MSMTNKIKEHIGFHYLLTKNNVVHLGSFEIEYIPQGVLSKIKDKSIRNKTFKQNNFLEYMIAGNTLLAYTN